MSLPCSVDALWLWRAGLYGWPWPSLARHGIGVTRNDLFRFGSVEQGRRGRGGVREGCGSCEPHVQSACAPLVLALCLSFVVSVAAGEGEERAR